MTDWMKDSIGNAALQESQAVIGRSILSQALGNDRPKAAHGFSFVAESVELVAFSVLDSSDHSELRAAAEIAFEHLRTLTRNDVYEPTSIVLRTVCYGILADRTPDVARMLRDLDLSMPDLEHRQWGERVRLSVTNVWLKLLRKKGWADLDDVFTGIVQLRSAQKEHEEAFLKAEPRLARSYAWELVSLYHLAKAADILATYTAQGIVGGGFDVREQLQAQFDRSISACQRAELVELYSITRLLARTASQMVSNSIWTITRAVNSRITKFAEQLADRTRVNPIFEMLPPQRIALRENGLLGSGHRAVVVSLPTSSGKTFIAQFRILQALNQFETELGWVAYVVPTRALVNQICAKLRRDFEPLNISVERVSPALEIDGVEAAILSDRNPQQAFRVLVGTPEKFDLLLRGGWEAKIGRPLTLVVVDEAHSISGGQRGLRLELLLATINRECRFSQFLLLTPFIENRSEIAKWLSPDSFTDVSVSFEWKPNDRAIVIAQPQKSETSGNFHLDLKTVHTNRETIDVSDVYSICDGRPLGLTWSAAHGSLSKVAAITADCLNRRGTTIVVAGTVPHAWSIADTLASSPELSDWQAKSPVGDRDGDIAFVSEFVEDEFGADFALLKLLQKGIGLHHSGLSDETRVLMEWLMERGHLNTLVATTTIAQGVNFPVSGVVLASHQHPYGEDMSPEEFWNLAGRAGRSDQDALGIVALVANSDSRAELLTNYVQRNVSTLNSFLIEMLRAALAKGSALELQTLFYMKEWSAFLQYLAHSYRQIGDHETFSAQIEQVLRGSFGFQKIRQSDPESASLLADAVRRYAAIIRGKPLALVDSTGFSWESVSKALSGIREEHLGPSMWDPDKLFSPRNNDLAKAFGVLFKIPEIREELSEVIHGRGADGDLLARIVKDWVGGASIPAIAKEYFYKEGGDTTDSITDACKSVYGKLIQTASWGLSAIQSLTIGDELEKMSETEQMTLRNLPSRIYYGVDSNEAIDLRVLGVPRRAAQPLANVFVQDGVTGTPDLRLALKQLDVEGWKSAIGPLGQTYRRAWQVFEGRE